jgi:hypothetical protein
MTAARQTPRNAKDGALRVDRGWRAGSAIG